MAILLSEIDPEPIEVLTDLVQKGYFWIQVTPANSETIEGDLVGEDEETVTLKVETSPEGMQTVSKSNLKTYVTVTLFDSVSVVGTLVSENEDQVVLEVSDVERTIDKFDIDEGPTYSRAFGKRISVKSAMPDNYAQLLSVDDHYNLLAFLSTLTGKTAGSESGPAISLRPKQTFTKFPLNQPVYIKPEPGTDQLLVIELGGKLRRFKDDPEAENAEFLIDTGRETYGLTFHPNYEENGYLYVVSNGPIGGKVTETKNYVSRFTVERQPPYGCDPNSELILLEWLSNNHNGGDLAFGPDGYLYIPAGDGAMDSDTNLTGLPGSYDRDPKGQDLSNLPATIMRIDVDRPEAERPYSIPSDNPFVHLEGARPEIWVYGIRNPWRITFDRETGHLWAGKRWAGSVGDDSFGSSWGQLRLEPLRRQPSLLPQQETGTYIHCQADGRTPPLRSPFNHRGCCLLRLEVPGVAGCLRLRRLRNWKNVGIAARRGETYLAPENRRYNATDREFRH